MNKIAKIPKIPNIWIICIWLITILLFFRSFLSFSWADESFYLSTVHRLWQGDRIFVDEWYGTQTYAVLLIPFYTLFMFIRKGDTTGIYLAARLFYLVISCVCALYIYFKLSKYHSNFISFLCAIAYFVYSRGNNYGLSYYSICLSLLLISVVTIYDVKCSNQLIEKQGYKKMLFAGLAMALSVTCNPYMIIPVLAVLIFFILFFPMHKYLKAVMFFIGGCVLASILYFGYVFSRISFSELIDILPYILSDPEHGQGAIFTSFYCVVRAIFNCFYYYSRSIFGITLYIIIRVFLTKLFPFASKIGKNEVKVIILISSVMCAVTFLKGRYIPGYSYLSISLWIAPIIVLFWNCFSKTRDVIFVFYFTGIVLAVSWGMASNTGVDATTLGFVVSTIGVFLIIDILIKDSYLSSELIIKGICYTAIIASVFITGILKIFAVYRDAGILELSSKIDAGPAKGLYTTERHLDEYYDIYGFIQNELNSYPNGNFFITAFVPWAYLCTDMRCASYTTWKTTVDNERLEEYYEKNYQKLPDYVLIVNEYYGNCSGSFGEFCGESKGTNDNSLDGFLLNYINKKKVNEIKTKCGVLYVLDKNI